MSNILQEAGFSIMNTIDGDGNIVTGSFSVRAKVLRSVAHTQLPCGGRRGALGRSSRCPTRAVDRGTGFSPYFPSHLFSASTYLHIRYLILSVSLYGPVRQGRIHQRYSSGETTLAVQVTRVPRFASCQKTHVGWQRQFPPVVTAYN